MPERMRSNTGSDLIASPRSSKTLSIFKKCRSMSAFPGFFPGNSADDVRDRVDVIMVYG